MKTRSTVLTLLVILLTNNLRAEEGMWLLSLLNGYTIEDMQSKGFKLSAEDIYSVNQACLKDAVVIFGGGCTGEMISADGLVLTNHHCGYGAIQSHSSVENDYLTDGFWAMSIDEELPNPRLSVSFLRYMKDVGQEVLSGTENLSDQDAIDLRIKENIAEITEEASEDDKYNANVESMFYGNQYYLFVYERYTDVRLVGAPPSSIGNFGEDNDNWVWPRHTGDFSIFRVYADSNNEPADYSSENVPYKPKKFFEISTSGIKEGDFTMILGYPGSTQQFLYSGAIKTMMEESLPLRIDLRTRRLDIMDRYMKESDVVRIQYASKYRGVSNAWKKWQGAIKGLERLDAVNKKLAFESKFSQWVEEDADRKEKYASLLPTFDDIYGELEEYQIINDLMREAVFSVEIFRIGSTLSSMMSDTLPSADILQRAGGLYKDYYYPIDMEIFAQMMNVYKEKSDPLYYPGFYAVVDKKFKGDFTAYARKIFVESPLRSTEALGDFLKAYDKNPSKAAAKLSKDPLMIAFNQFRMIYISLVMPQMQLLNESLNDLYKVWVQGNMEMQPNVRQYPDANFTMRLTYGKVEGYSPEDAVIYDYYTTLSGVIEKSKEDQPDYVIPERLQELYVEKDFGNYGENGTMPVCFSASNHTSGGNSGSPVLDAEGRLIGINFDRNWHGTMSDEMYDPDMCRNISVDIRYVLFVIDKYAGAGYLLDEMKLVGDQ